MANNRNLALNILVSARDAASGVLHGIGAGINRLGSGVARVAGDIRTQLAALAASFGLLATAKEAIGNAAGIEALEAQFAALEGSAEAAAAKIQELDAAFGLRQVEQAQKLYADLASFGLKPTVEQLGDLIDFNARTGKGAENLQGIVAQLGQAWGKQKLQYEDILILLERGVPIWELLSKATGKTAAQLTEMATKGELGRDAIRKLIAEMGKVAEGASTERLTTWNGLVESAEALWRRFTATVANAGVFEQAKTYLSQIADALERAIADGSAVRWGEQIAQGARDAATWLQEAWASAKTALAEWEAKIGTWGETTQAVLGAAQAAWLAFRQSYELVAAGIAAGLGTLASGISLVVDGLHAVGLASEETANKAQNVADSLWTAAKDANEKSATHYKEMMAKLAELAGAHEAAGQAATALAEKEEAAGDAEARRALELGILKDELAGYGVVLAAGAAAQEKATRHALLAWDAEGKSLEDLVAQRDRLKAAIAAEGAASAQAAPLVEALVEVQQALAAAAKQAAEDMEVAAKAVERNAHLEQAQLSLRREELEILSARAKARGDDLEALSLSIDASRRDLEAVKAAAAAKRDEAAVLAERARLLQIAAEASGDLTAKTRDQIAATADAAKMAEIEAKRLDIAAIAKDDAADAGARLHDKLLKLKAAFSEVGDGSIDSMEEVRQAIGDAADADELKALERGLKQAFASGALAAKEYSALLAQIQGQQGALKRQVTGQAGVDFEALFAEVGSDMGRARAKLGNDAFGAGLLADYQAWLRAQASGTERAPAPGESGFAASQLRPAAAPAAADSQSAAAAARQSAAIERLERAASALEAAGRSDIVVAIDGYAVARATEPYRERIEARRV